MSLIAVIKTASCGILKARNLPCMEAKTDLAKLLLQEHFGSEIVCWPCLCIFSDTHVLTHKIPRYIRNLLTTTDSSHHCQRKKPLTFFFFFLTLSIMLARLSLCVYVTTWEGSSHSFADGLKGPHVFQTSCGLVNTFQ